MNIKDDDSLIAVIDELKHTLKHMTPYSEMCRDFNEMLNGFIAKWKLDDDPHAFASKPALDLRTYEDQVAKGIGIPREFFAITPPKEEEVQPRTPQWLLDEAHRQLSAGPDEGKEAIAACMATNAVETIAATHRLQHFARTGRFPTDHENESAKPHTDIGPTAPPMRVTFDLNGPTRGGRVAAKGPEFKKVGFWREARKPMCEMFHMTYGQGPIESSYPDVNDCIDPEWKRDHFEEYAKVTNYLATGKIKDAYKGSSCCRICGKTDNGSCDITDGMWVWPEGFIHYIATHYVKPPQEFIDYIMEKTK